MPGKHPQHASWMLWARLLLRNNSWRSAREQLVFYASIYLLCLDQNKTAKMVYYENCCFCFKSKTGAKIIAILGLVFACLAILANIIGLLVHQLGPLGWVATIGGSIAIQIGVLNVYVYIVFYALGTLCQIGYLAIFALLFHGVKKERHGLLVPFLVFHMISLVVSYFKLLIF